MITREQINTVIQAESGIEPSKVTESAGLVEDLGMDSLDTIELVMALEEEFDVDITDEQAEGVKTVGDIYLLLEVTDGVS